MKKSAGGLTPEERGPLFEGMVAQLLRAYKDYRSSFDEMYYWAPSSGSKTEVDFLLLKDDQFIAIEAKSGKNFSQPWCRGLRAIKELKGIKRRIIIYPDGPVLRTEDGIDVIPFQIFADQLSRGIFI
jgi:predicted AAA+ superfamily ATPase